MNRKIILLQIKMVNKRIAQLSILVNNPSVSDERKLKYNEQLKELQTELSTLFDLLNATE